MLCFFNRILDNLPLVFPIPRLDQENSLVYQHGFHVGLRGQYAGVSAQLITFCFDNCFLCNPFLLLYVHDVFAEQRAKTFYSQSLGIYCQISQRCSDRFCQDCWI